MKMLIPKEFAAKDRRKMIAFIQRYPFATVISVTDEEKPSELAIVKIPLKVVPREDELVLEGHFASSA